MLFAVRKLIALFGPRCEDTVTLFRLLKMIDDKGSWSKAHALFGDIRKKTLQAEKRGDSRALAQYRFEEVCAKAVFNMTRPSAPFDPHSPYWIVPNALKLARALEMDTDEVVTCVAPIEAG